MNAKTLRKAITEAERFLSEAKKLRGTIKKEHTCQGYEYEAWSPERACLVLSVERAWT